MKNEMNEIQEEKYVPASVWIAFNPVWLKAHQPTEKPTGVYYTIATKPEDATVTFYSRRENTKDYYKKEE